MRLKKSPQNIIVPRATDTLLGNAKGENVCRTIRKLIEVKIKNLTITKLSKISTIVDAVNNGQIIFIDNNKEAIEQLLNFCGQQYSVHDDFPDCVAEAYIKIKEIKGNTKITLLDRSCLF